MTNRPSYTLKRLLLTDEDMEACFIKLAQAKKYTIAFRARPEDTDGLAYDMGKTAFRYSQKVKEISNGSLHVCAFYGITVQDLLNIITGTTNDIVVQITSAHPNDGWFVEYWALETAN